MLNDPKNFKIPEEFILFGHKYKVQIETDLLEKEDCYGIADEDLKLIRLQGVGEAIMKYKEDGKDCTSKIQITDETITETFFHEIMHIVLYASGEEALSENERFVNVMGKALLEIYLTSKYEQNSKSKNAKRKNNSFRIAKKR